MMAELLLIAHWTFVIALALRVIMRRATVGVSLAWVTVILLLPMVGPALYVLVGENRLGARRARRAAELRKPFHRWLMTLRTEESVDWGRLHPAGRPLSSLGRNLIGIPALIGNRLELLADSEAALRAIIADIDRAQRTCHLEFYIWAAGGTPDEVVDALMRAARRGVRCRVLVDAVGSKEFLRSSRADEMRDSGVELLAGLPVGLFRALFVRLDLRIHRKIVVIDGEIAYTGSLNLADARHFKKEAGVGHWVDAMVRVEGPAVEALAATFLADWQIEGSEELEELRRTGDLKSVDDAGEAVVQVVPTGPRQAPGAIHEMILTTVYSARRELVMTTPYFVPDEALVTALVSAARRGVEVTIVLPEKVDSWLVSLASGSNIEDLLDAGVRIVRYREGLLHTKAVTVDRSIGLIGSVNLDMRSFWLNFEITLFVYDTEFAARLHDMQMEYARASEPIEPAKWKQRGLPRRFAENFVRLLGPLL